MRIVLMVLACLPAMAAEDQFLKWMDRIAQRQLDAREAAVAKVRTTQQAESRKAAVRGKILELLGGLPDYQGPLNARTTGRLERPGYTVEKVIFESLPDFYITANLYRPSAAGKYPGVLFPMGHWEQGKPAAQRMAANLALKGFVVLAYDPIGQGERQQAFAARTGASLAGGSTEQHFLAGAQSILAGENFARYRIWDARRALDYLVSRPEVEAGKIGCTGCSGGGTLTAYISALDPRITVAAPACYISTWRLLFTGPTGDSEQSFPNFLAAGLDVADYIELFAPKPYLIASTVGDFFPIEGARRAYQEALEWYRVYGAADKIRWAIGPGEHGTPLEIREAIYEWMIRWLRGGRGDFREQPLEMAPDFVFQVTERGQVEGRDVYQVVLEGYRKRQRRGSRDELTAELRKWVQPGERRAPAARVVSESAGAGFRTQQLALEAEPGLEIGATLYLPEAGARRPAVLLVDGAGPAARLARGGAVVLNLLPRGVAESTARSGRLSGNWAQNTRAWLIGRNLAGMRASDILRGVDLLAARPEVEPGAIRAAARGAAGVWLLMAAALDTRIGKVWLDRTPYSLRIALETPLSRNLHDAVIPGFALRWDLADLAAAIRPRPVLWSDPTDWMGRIAPRLDGFLYRYTDEPDGRFVEALMR